MDTNKLVVNKIMNATGVISSNNSWDYYEMIEVKGNTTYTISRKNSGWFQINILQYDETKTLLEESRIAVQKQNLKSHTFVTQKNTKYLNLAYAKKYKSGNESVDVDWTEMMLSEGTEVTNYEPFVPNKPTVNYPGKIKTVGKEINEFTTNNFLKLHSNEDTYMLMDDNTFKLKNNEKVVSYSGAFFEFGNLKKNEDYEIGFDYNMTITSTATRFRINGIDANNVVSLIVDTTLENAHIHKVIFNTKEYTKIQIAFYSNWNMKNGNELKVFNIYLKNGKGHSYTPYRSRRD